MKKEKVKQLKSLFGILKMDIGKLPEEKFLEVFYLTLLTHYGVMVRYLDSELPVIESIFGMCTVSAGTHVRTQESFKALCVDTQRDREALRRLISFTEKVLAVIVQSYQSAVSTNERYLIQGSSLHCEIEISEEGLRLVPGCLEDHLAFVPGMENPDDPLVKSNQNLIEHIQHQGIELRILELPKASSLENAGEKKSFRPGGLHLDRSVIFSRFVDTNYRQTVTYSLFKLLDELSLDRLFQCSDCGRFEVTDKKKHSDLCKLCQTKHRVEKWRENHPEEWKIRDKLQKSGRKKTAPHDV